MTGPDAGTHAPRSGRPGPTRMLAWLAALSAARPRIVLAVAAALTALAIAWAATHLELRTSNLDLVDPDLPPVAAFRDLARTFGTPNSLVVVLEGSDPIALRRMVDRLTPLLAAVDGTRSVFGRLPGDPGTLLRMGIDPYLTSRRAEDGEQTADRPELAFLFVQPRDAESRAETIAPWVDGVRRVLEREGLRGGAASGSSPGGSAPTPTTPTTPTIRAGLTGLPQYAIDDRDAVQHDLAVLSPVSFVVILLLFVGSFTALRRPLAVMLALLAGVAVTLGLAAVWPGHLTLLSAFFGSVLFGLGVDFGIHVVDRTEEILAGGLGEGGGDRDAAGETEGRAVVAAVASLAPALATGAATTASAFAVMALSGFRGFAELGAIAGAGVPLCLLAMVTVLPALLVLLPAAGARPGRFRLGRSRDRRLGGWLVRLQSPALAVALAAAAIGGPLLVRPGFDTDYLNLEPAGSEAVHWEREMVRRSPYSPQFAAFVADSRRQAGALAERLARDPTVGEVHSVADLDLLTALGARADSPEMRSLRQRFVGADGRTAVYAYPKDDIWREPAGTRFLAHMKAIDPGVTGLPVLGRFMIERSHRALAVTGILAGLAILAWALVDLRDPVLAVLAILPTLLGAGAMLALMGVLGVAFNPLDVMALPLVLGIAVDDGVHIVHRFLAEGGDVSATLRGTGRSVVLTSLTSLAAFGVLAFARHRGLASFGAAAGLGVAASLVLSVLVLPQALRAWAIRRSRSSR